MNALLFAVLLASTSIKMPDFDLADVIVDIRVEDLRGIVPPVSTQKVALRKPCYDGIHRVAIAGRENAALRDALAQLPGITLVSIAEDVDLVVEYDETRGEEETHWNAKLYRLKCQDGECEDRVYVRVPFDEMRGVTAAGKDGRAILAFADELRAALLTSPAPQP